MNIRQIKTAFACTLSILITLPAVSHEKEDLRWSLQALPETIDNLEWKSLDRWYIITQLFQTLVTFDKSRQLVGALSDSWTVSKDKRAYIFHIRENAKFSNGENISPEDVIFSLKRYLLTQPNTDLFKSNIAGYTSLKDIQSSILGLSVLDSSHIQLRLIRRMENIWSFLALPMVGGVVSKKNIDIKTLKMIQPPVSSGPYKINKTQSTHISLIRNPHFLISNDAPKTVGFYIHINTDDAVRLFKEGTTNFAAIIDPFDYSAYSSLIDQKNINLPLHRVGAFVVNPNRFRSAGTRRSLSKLFRAAAEELNGNPLLKFDSNFFPPGTPGYKAQSKTLDDLKLETAVKIKFERPIECLFEQGIASASLQKAVLSTFKASDIGIHIQNEVKINLVNRVKSRDFDIAFLTFGLPIYDPGLAIYMYFFGEPSYLPDNSGQIKFLYTQALQTLDALKRKEIYFKISDKINKSYTVIPIFHTGVKYVLGNGVNFDNPESYRTEVQIMNLRIKRR